MASHVRDSSAHSNLLTAGEGLPTGSSRVIAVRLVVLSCCSLTAIWSYLSCVAISPTNLARTSCCSHVRFSMASHSNLFSSCIASISSRIDDVSDNRLWVSSKLPSSWKCTVTIPCQINWSRQRRCPQQQCQVQASLGPHWRAISSASCGGIQPTYSMSYSDAVFKFNGECNVAMIQRDDQPVMNENEKTTNCADKKTPVQTQKIHKCTKSPMIFTQYTALTPKPKPT